LAIGLLNHTFKLIWSRIWLQMTVRVANPKPFVAAIEDPQPITMERSLHFGAIELL
jgi:hypothetical protein